MNSPALEVFAKLTMDSSEFDKGLDKAKEGANGFASSFKNVGSAVMGGLATVGKSLLAVYGTASAAVLKLGKDAVESFGNYEQLVGGVQKLYGNAGQSLEEYAQSHGKSVDEIRDEWQSLEDSQNAVIKNAEQAYLTSGMSMNEYMQTATSFSAALINSLGGDTEKAAEITDIAMRAMSDNVNTFGSDAEAVSNAFMGLSRNNYTMIDNLKLGYSGTAQGMLELINDSGVLGRTLTDTSELAEVGFDKMVLAIQAVQEQQGIAGTTAREALHTIEGSATATRKAWENIITAIGKGEGIGDAISGLMTALLGDESGGGFINNIIPRIKTVAFGIADALMQMSPVIADVLPSLFNALFPSMFSAATSLIATLGEALPVIIGQLFPILSDTAGTIISTFVGYILENLPLLLESGISLIGSMAEGARNNLPEMLKTAIYVLRQVLSEIVQQIPAFLVAGLDLILGLGEGLLKAVPALLDASAQLISDLMTSFVTYDWASLGKSIIDGIVEGIKNFGGMIGQSLLNLAGDAFQGVKNFFGIKSPSRLMRDEIGRYLPSGIAEGIEDNSDDVFDAMKTLAKGTELSYNPIIDAPSVETDSGGNSLLTILINEIRALKEALGGMTVTLDTGEVVGGIAYAMDTQLGTIADYKGRGN